MVSITHYLGLQVNPHQLAIVLLCSTACLLTLTTFPTSSFSYLIRTDYRAEGAGTVSTTWLGNFGYCVATAFIDSKLDFAEDPVKCSMLSIGIDTNALTNEGTLPEWLVGAGRSSIVASGMTRSPAIMNPLAIILCLISIFAYRAIPSRPTGTMYVAAMGASLTALLLLILSLTGELLFAAYLNDFGNYGKTGDSEFTSSLGPAAYAIMLAALAQAGACVVGFYTCIGGKYEREGWVRFEEEKTMDV
ncbi:hypothetical protein F5Y18DRAFT_424525 [Xylariaceae sp. FL1019]|nr:hypothetical protein F5Y18DRAFT_424525 [Xylariaceae sp. FL1019]